MPDKPSAEQFAEMEKRRVDEAMAECLAVLKKHDVCAHLLIVGRGHMHTRTVLDPAWCRLAVVKRGGYEGIALRSTRDDYAGDIERQADELRWSVGLAHSFGRVLGVDGAAWLGASMEFDKATGARHAPFTPTDTGDA